MATACAVLKRAEIVFNFYMADNIHTELFIQSMGNLIPRAVKRISK